jgi:DNA-binding winged helix-turn-helix (wHTH) protein
MPTPKPTSRKLRFGAFVLDGSAGQLRKNSTLIRLPPQPFRLLQLLTERAGTVVTREEIRNTLWTDATFVDFEHGINFSINQIRAALADNAEKPRFIETLPRRGYRFIATVEQLNGNTPVHRAIDAADNRPVIDTATFQFPPIFVYPPTRSEANADTAPSTALPATHPTRN